MGEACVRDALDSGHDSAVLCGRHVAARRCRLLGDPCNQARRVAMVRSRHHTVGFRGVARQTGFSDRDQMRRAFLRAFGQPPQVLRRNAQNETKDWQNHAEV
jgi:hypothetical protein